MPQSPMEGIPLPDGTSEGQLLRNGAEAITPKVETLFMPTVQQNRGDIQGNTLYLIPHIFYLKKKGS